MRVLLQYGWSTARTRKGILRPGPYSQKRIQSGSTLHIQESIGLTYRHDMYRLYWRNAYADCKLVISRCSASYGSWQRDTARICCGATAVERRQCSNRSISPARRAHSSKPGATACGGRMVGRTDRETDGRTDAQQLHRPCCAFYAGNASKRNAPVSTLSLSL